jgi:hypothetical protein
VTAESVKIRDLMIPMLGFFFVFVFGIYEIVAIATSFGRIDLICWLLGALSWMAAIILAVVYSRQDWIEMERNYENSAKTRYFFTFITYVIVSFVAMLSDINGGDFNFATFSMAWRLVGGFAISGVSGLVVTMMTIRYIRTRHHADQVLEV